MKIGDRVQLHPATDQWMMGDKYGTIVGFTKGRHRTIVGGEDMNRVHWPRVRMDVSGRVLRVNPLSVYEVLN